MTDGTEPIPGTTPQEIVSNSKVVSTEPGEELANDLMQQWTAAYGVSDKLRRLGFQLGSNSGALEVLEDPERFSSHSIYSKGQPVDEKIEQLKEENKLLVVEINNNKSLEQKAWSSLSTDFSKLDDGKKVELLDKFLNASEDQYPNPPKYGHEDTMLGHLFSNREQYSNSKARDFFSNTISELNAKLISIEDCINLSRIMNHGGYYDADLNVVIRNKLIESLAQNDPEKVASILDGYFDKFGLQHHKDQPPFGKISKEDFARMLSILPQPLAEKHIFKVVEIEDYWRKRDGHNDFLKNGYFKYLSEQIDLKTTMQNWGEQEKVVFLKSHFKPEDLNIKLDTGFGRQDKVEISRDTELVLSILQDLSPDSRKEFLVNFTQIMERYDTEFINGEKSNTYKGRDYYLFVEQLLDDFTIEDIEAIWLQMDKLPYDQVLGKNEHGQPMNRSGDTYLAWKIRLLSDREFGPTEGTVDLVLKAFEYRQDNEKLRKYPKGLEAAKKLLNTNLDYWTPKFTNFYTSREGSKINDKVVEYILKNTGSELADYSDTLISLLLDSEYSTQVYDRCKSALDTSNWQPEDFARFAEDLGKQILLNGEFGDNSKGMRAGSALIDVLNREELVKLKDEDLLACVENFMFDHKNIYRFQNYKPLFEKFDRDILQASQQNERFTSRLRNYGQNVCKDEESLSHFMECLDYFIEEIKLDDKDQRSLVGVVLTESLSVGVSIKVVLDRYKDKVPNFSSFIENEPYLKTLSQNFGIGSFENLEEFIHDHDDFFQFIKKDPNQAISLESSDLEFENLPFKGDLIILELAKRNGVNLQDIKNEDYKTIFEKIKGNHPDWKDEQSICEPFQQGAETFGYRRMFEYVDRDELTLHDAVHAFRDVVALFKVSELEADEFYSNVLHQVTMDGSEYSEGTAHHHLNSIAQTANPNVGEVIGRVQEYRDIERLQELATTFDSPQAVFSSWTNLKRYSELEQLLGQTEVFDELKELKAEGKDALYHYVETLAFHPDSKVNMEAVFQFWRNPEYFLVADASHTPDEIQDRKKPSNYTHMPNLDLTAIELRDALVEGKMDQIQTFAPLEIRYKIPIEDYEPEPMLDTVSKALGSRKKGIEGTARNPQKLFSEINALLKPYGINVVKYLQGEQLPEAVDPTQLEALVYDQNFGMERPQVKTREFVARINRKSDPEGAIAGDDTVNCMPFGDGKNTVYTFNPNTAQFVIRVVKGDGKERTIAQSVMTKDMDIKTPVPDVISQLEREGGHLEDVLTEDVLRHAPTYAAGDNVEVSPNFSDKRHQQIIEAIMRDYFREYMSRYAEAQGLDPAKVPIGQGYTDALSNLPTAQNTFAPQAPVSYSDKTGVNVYMLDLTTDEGSKLILERSVTAPDTPQVAQPALPDVPGIDYLTFEDSLRVGYLEGKAYADNESLMQFLFNMENALIAKDINNAAKGRPNMSLKYTDGEGQMRGYFLAWEGKLTDENVEYDAQDFYDQPCVYMLDIATDQESRMAGGRLIKAFIELYKQNYLDQDNPLPIFAQARETTSFKIVQRQLDRIGREAGVEFELIELPAYDVGDDTMHPIIIQPKK